MWCLRNIGRIIFIAFSLQIGIDGILMSYFIYPDHADVSHMTTDYSIDHSSQHTHHEHLVVFSSACNRNIVPIRHFPIFLTEESLAFHFTFSIWQPPRFS